jgi:hypothetical protein
MKKIINWNNAPTASPAAGRLRHDASVYLKQHPKPAAPEKPKPKRLERWQVTKNRERQERKELATPLLKGAAETAPVSRLISKT